MSDRGPYPSFYVPDEDGDHEVIDSRPATELDPEPPMLRVNLRRLRR